jgi:hypothetical protein
VKIPDDYQVPDDPDCGFMDAAYLRTCFGIPDTAGEEPQPLPEAVRRAHYVMSRTLQILGAYPGYMKPETLATVVALAVLNGAEVQEEKEAEYAFPVEEATKEQKVVIEYRKKDRPAHFLGVRESDGRILVLHEGKEIGLRPDLVRFPEEGEFDDVPDYINPPFEE